MAKNLNYQFTPAYYEWHFTDSDGNLLLVWVDPVEFLYNETDTDGNDLDEPQIMTTYDEVLDECESYLNGVKCCYEDDGEEHNGVPYDMYALLPENAAEIMAKALYEYYIAEPVDDAA